jgi:hypothetical protein
LVRLAAQVSGAGETLSSAALNQFAILFDGRVPMGGIGANSLTQNQN